MFLLVKICTIKVYNTFALQCHSRRVILMSKTNVAECAASFNFYFLRFFFVFLFLSRYDNRFRDEKIQRNCDVTVITLLCNIMLRDINIAESFPLSFFFFYPSSVLSRI